MITTAIKDINSLPFGTAELRVSDYQPYIDIDHTVLDETFYIGAQADVTFIASKSVKKSYNNPNNVKIMSAVCVDIVEITLSAKLYEFTSNTLKLLSGGIDSNFLNNLLSVNFWRFELIYRFPLSSRVLTVILPKIFITNNFELSWLVTDLKGEILTGNVCSADSDSVIWQDKPLGIMTLV